MKETAEMLLPGSEFEIKIVLAISFSGLAIRFCRTRIRLGPHPWARQAEHQNDYTQIGSGHDLSMVQGMVFLKHHFLCHSRYHFRNQEGRFSSRFITACERRFSRVLFNVARSFLPRARWPSNWESRERLCCWPMTSCWRKDSPWGALDQERTFPPTSMSGGPLARRSRPS